MTPLSKKTVQHFTHCHTLTEVSANTQFLCNGCKTLGFGTRYRCEPCDFDLHDHCATCPMELSSFMHDHDLNLLFASHRLLDNDRVCDLCGDPVEGLFYRCKLCEFDVHPLCTQLPENVRHVMHKDHPLRLQRSVPGNCMVCKDTCTSWHYRCEICCFDLHLECVLAPCEEAATTTSTPRSLKTPAPPPSAPPFFDACYGYGYGAIPPPPYFAYANYGVPFAPPYFAYANYGVPFAPPYFGPYAHSYGIPSSSGQYHVNSHHNHSSQAQGGGGKVRKKMYAIAGNLALGVLSNVVFGTFFS